MILNQVNKIEKEIIQILAKDTTIADLLFFTGNPPAGKHASAQDIINNKMITNTPVFLNEGDSSNFISVHLDNSILYDSEKTFVSTYKISCGCSHSTWLLPDGNTRVYTIGNRIEELLNHKTINNSTGSFILNSINNVYWNALTTGITMIFQMVESNDINNGTIL